jgi:hypothetical protein
MTRQTQVAGFTKKMKKSQIKIQEMAFMLLAVMFFFILAGLFFLSIYSKGLSEKALETKRTKTITALSNLADTPEFSCSILKSNCVDGDKLAALINKTNYKNLWTFSSLKLLRSVAFNKTEEDLIKCTYANYPDCEIFIVFDKKDKNIEFEEQSSSYVALCRKEFENGVTYDKCEIAKLIAGTKRNAK